MTAPRWFLAGLAGLLLITAAAYAPGLQGGFLFDDFVNLDAIGATGPVDDWPTFWRYLTSGNADPTGRPLAMLSFLLDARDWPAEPGPFLRTNLLIHLANGVLLACLLLRAGRLLGTSARDAGLAALLAAGLWLLHPLLVSTTLYVVQRQAMLAAGFSLAALLAYLACRERHARSGSRGALAGAALSLSVGTALAMSCKANGILLPILTLVLESTVLRNLPRPLPRAMRWLLLYLPACLVGAYLMKFLGHWGDFLPERGWSVWQRLMSEPRALLHYLLLWFVPRAMSSGLYNDDFMASTSLISPWTTLPSILALVAVAALAWRTRESRPDFSAAILFFFGAHLLESSSYPLELYFEHRNYLPAALLFWPPSLALLAWRIPSGRRIAIACAALALVLFATVQRVQLWKQPDRLALAWALQHPGSSRAQATAAMFDVSQGRASRARQRLAVIWRDSPTDLQLAFNYINSACASGGIGEADAAALERALAGARRGLPLMHRWLDHAIDVATEGSCRGLDLPRASRWVESMARNQALPAGADRDQEVQPLLARIALAQGRPDLAVGHFDRSLRAAITPDNAARQAAQLAGAGAYEQALAHLDLYDRLAPGARRPAAGMAWVHAWVLREQGYWPREMAILRGKLREAIASRDRAVDP
jgi:tetratricopeptide (TPR) repeat protein